MRITLRPTIAGDLAALKSERPPYRIKALTALLGDIVLGIGGLGFKPDGTVVAFVDMTEEARRYPAAIHRAGLAAMQMIKASGLPLIIAEPQPGNPAAERWLERLGFAPVETKEGRAYVWQRQ